MSDISKILNGEAGLSVRDKLNEVIDKVNASAVVVPVGDAALYDPAKAGGYPAGSIVSYRNEASPDAQFQTFAIYVANSDIPVGVSPEDSAEWLFKGDEYTIEGGNTSKNYVNTITALRSVSDIKNGDTMIVGFESRIYEFVESSESGIKPFQTGVGSWIARNRVSLSNISRVYTSLDALENEEIPLPVGNVVISFADSCVFTITDGNGDAQLPVSLSAPSIVTKKGAGFLASDIEIELLTGGQSNLVKILDAELAGNDMALQLPVNGAVLALHTGGSFRWVDSNNTLLATVIFTEYSLITRTGAGTTLADITIKPLKDLIFDLPQNRVTGLVAKLIELEQSNPVRNVEFLRSTTISLFGETYYNTTVEEGSGAVLNITVPITATTQGTANEIAQFASVPVLTGEAFTVRQVNINVLAYKNATSRVVSIYFELWNMDSSGVLTQLGTSNILTLTEQPLSKDLFLSLDPNYVTSVGDRAILIGRAFQTGSGVSATATISIDDQTGSRWSFDVVAQAVGGGHTILDPAGNAMPTQPALQFGDGFTVTDEAGKTVVGNTAASHINGADEAKHSANQIINAAALDAISTPINTPVSSILTGINDALKLQVDPSTSQTLIFDKVFKRQLIVQTGFIEFSVSPTGNIDGSTILLILEADNTNPTYFTSAFTRIGGEHVLNVNNYYYFQYIGNGQVLYSVSQGVQDLFDITSLPGLVLYLDGDDPSTIVDTGTGEVTWADKSPLADTWRHARDSFVPSYSESNKGWLMGAGKCLQADVGISLTTGQYTRFVVFDKTVSGDNSVMSGGSNAWYLVRGTTVSVGVANSQNFTFTTPNGGTIFKDRSSSTTGYLERNGVQVATTSIIGNITTTLSLLGVYTLNNPSQSFNGHIKAVVIFNRFLSESESAKVVGALNAKFNVY